MQLTGSVHIFPPLGSQSGHQEKIRNPPAACIVTIRALTLIVRDLQILEDIITMVASTHSIQLCLGVLA